MIYKDSKFEIDDKQIKFKNGTFLLFLIPFVSISTYSFMVSKGNILQVTAALIGLRIGIIVIRQFVGLYLKNTIDLSSVDYVKRQFWNKTIDEERNFWGIGKFKYHFPTGINKNTNQEVIFIHIKGKKAVIGFVPENMENVIAVFKEKDIRIIKETAFE